TQVGMIRRLNSDGSISEIAGSTAPACASGVPSGDEGSAMQACLGFVSGLAIAPDEQIYLMNGGSIRRIDLAGNIHNVLLPAITSAYLLGGFQVAPDYSIYVLAEPVSAGSTGRFLVVKALNPDGTIRHVAGIESGTETCADDDGSGGIRA